MKPNSYTYKLTPEQQNLLTEELAKSIYDPFSPPHSKAGGKRPNCSIALYISGKCLIQGKGAAEFVEFIMEPHILKSVGLGYEEVLRPEFSQPHMGIDESGKGDFFGPLVIAAAYVDADIVAEFKSMGVRDSKTVTSDNQIRKMAAGIRQVLKGRFAIVTIGPESYNKLYTTMANVNKMLAWGHARAIEDLLEKVPDCPHAVSDQFGPTTRIESALMKKGKKITLEQRPKAEDDPAVAAASILARAGFVEAMIKMGDRLGVTIPKGASAQVKACARNLVETHGPAILRTTSKLHFRTTDQVLESFGGRAALN